MSIDTIFDYQQQLNQPNANNALDELGRLFPQVFTPARKAGLLNVLQFAAKPGNVFQHNPNNKITYQELAQVISKIDTRIEYIIAMGSRGANVNYYIREVMEQIAGDVDFRLISSAPISPRDLDVISDTLGGTEFNGAKICNFYNSADLFVWSERAIDDLLLEAAVEENMCINDILLLLYPIYTIPGKNLNRTIVRDTLIHCIKKMRLLEPDLWVILRKSLIRQYKESNRPKIKHFFGGDLSDIPNNHLMLKPLSELGQAITEVLGKSFEMYLDSLLA